MTLDWLASVTDCWKAKGILAVKGCLILINDGVLTAESLTSTYYSLSLA